MDGVVGEADSADRAAPDAGAGGSRRVGPSEIVAILAVAFVAAPFVVAIVTRAWSDWFPIHDIAVIDLRVRDVVTSDSPLVGAYSRFGWNHPGPISYWMMAGPSVVAGGAAWGTLVGGTAIQLLAVIWTGLASWRIGRTRLVLAMMAVLGASYWALGAFLVLEPWNPHLAYPWLPLLCLQAWRLSLGEWRWLPGFVFVSSFLVQTHVGYAPLVAGVLLVSAGGMVFDARRAARPLPRPTRRGVLASAAVAAVLWAPVVLDQVVHRPGNLALLWRYFVAGEAGDEPVAGLTTASGILGGTFRTLLAPWSGPEALEYFTGSVAPPSPAWLLVPVLLLVGSWAAARRLGEAELCRFTVVLAALLATGVIGLARATGDLVPYLFYWRFPVVALVLADVGLVAAAALQRLPERSRRTSLGVAGAAALVLSMWWGTSVLIGVVTHPEPILAREVDAVALVEQLEGDLAPGESVRVEWRGSALGGVHGGIVDHLDREGVAVRLPERLGFQFGASRTEGAAEVDQVWLVVEEGRLVSELSGAPGARVIARRYPLGEATEQELVDLQRGLAAQLRAAGRSDLLVALDGDLVAYALADVPGIDAEAVGRLAELNGEVDASGGCRCAVIAFPPDAVPEEEPTG